MHVDLHFMQKIWFSLSALVLVLSLTSCSGGQPSDVGNEVSVITRVPVQISVPKAWREIKPQDLSAMGDDLVISYASLNYANGFANNISVTKETLPASVSSLQYAEANMVNSAKFLDSYLKLNEQDVSLQDEDGKPIPTKLHTFQARVDRVERQRKYLQIYIVKDLIGYTATVVVPLDEPDLGKYENLLKSFRLVRQ